MIEFLLILPILLVSVIVHEVAHRYTALRLGDPTAKQAVRLTDDIYNNLQVKIITA